MGVSVGDCIAGSAHHWFLTTEYLAEGRVTHYVCQKCPATKDVAESYGQIHSQWNTQGNWIGKPKPKPKTPVPKFHKNIKPTEDDNR